jgi:hypothetical protein
MSICRAVHDLHRLVDLIPNGSMPGIDLLVDGGIEIGKGTVRLRHSYRGNIGTDAAAANGPSYWPGIPCGLIGPPTNKSQKNDVHIRRDLASQDE